MKAARALRTYLWDAGCFWLLGLAGLKLAWVWFRLWQTAPDGGSSLLQFTWISLIVLIAPGLAFLRLAGYSDPSVLGRLVMIVSISLAITTAVVFQLYFFGIYHRWILVCVLGIFALAGAWGLAGVRPLRALGELHDAWRREGWLERIGWAFFTAYLLLVFERSIGAPFVDWDAIVSWDKWGCDMAERHGLGGYLMGGYPQLIPTLYSIYYKMAGTHLVDVPDEQLLLHGLMGLFPLILLGGLIRFCRLLGVPWVVASILLFSSSHVYSRIANGYVDIPVTAFAVVTAAAVAGWLRGTWRCRHPGFSWVVIGLLFYAVGFTKGHGLLWIAGLAAYAVVVLGRSNRLRLTWQPLLGCGLLATVLLAPFYAHQSHLSRNPHLVETDPRLHTLPVQLTGPAVKRFSVENLWGSAFEFMAGFDPRKPILRTWVLGTVFGLMLAGGLCHRPVWPWLAVSLALAGVWFATASYDLRNLLPAIVLWCVAAAAGVKQGSRLLPSRLGDTVAVVGIPIIATLSGRFLASEIRQFPALWGSPAVESRRVWHLAIPERLQEVNPDWAKLRFLLETCPSTKAATRVYMTNPLYRYQRTRWIYLHKAHSLSALAPGDVLVTHEKIEGAIRFTPMASFASFPQMRLFKLQPLFRPSNFTVREQDGGVELWVEALQGMKPGDSALIRIQIGTTAPDWRLQPHPQLLEHMDVAQMLHSVSQGDFVYYLLWFDKADKPPPLWILLHLTASPPASLVIRHIEVELASSR